MKCRKSVKHDSMHSKYPSLNTDGGALHFKYFVNLNFSIWYIIHMLLYYFISRNCEGEYCYKYIYWLIITYNNVCFFFEYQLFLFEIFLFITCDFWQYKQRDLGKDMNSSSGDWSVSRFVCLVSFRWPMGGMGKNRDTHLDSLLCGCLWVLVSTNRLLLFVCPHIDTKYKRYVRYFYELSSLSALRTIFFQHIR